MGALWSFCPPAWTPNASRSSQLGARSAPGPPGWSQDGSKAIQDAMWLGLEKPKWPRSHPRTPLAWSQNGLRSPHLCGKSALRPPGPPKWVQDWTQDLSSCSQKRPRPCLGTHMLPPRHHNLSSECLQVLPTWSHGQITNSQ